MEKSGMAEFDRRLDELGLVLPQAPTPAANYLPFASAGGLIQLAGVAPSSNGAYAVVGKIGDDLDIEDGRRAASICALNLLAVLKLACEGDLDRVQRFVMLRGFVNATAEFERVPFVIDAASDLIISVFGPQVGSHARTSIGCATLPGRVAVELDALVLLRESPES